jgi:hypothetical protein
VSALPADLSATTGFVVADNRGKIVGRVECPMYGTLPNLPDALSVRGGPLSRHRRLVPANTIAEIDPTGRVVELRVPRNAIRRFL